MKITAVREATVGIESSIRNAYVDFRAMTVSAVAIVTDVRREGQPVTGFGFTSNGRYAAAGILRERMIPRLTAAPHASLLNEAGDNFDPARIWDVLMTNEKPGGHGERSTAVGALDMAVWDLVAKIDGKPLCRLLAECAGTEPDETVCVYAAGGYYRPGKTLVGLQDEMRSYLDLGYSTVKMKIGGEPLAEDLRRIEAVLEVVGEPERLAVDANARFDLPRALDYADALQPYGLRWYEEPGDPLDYELNRRVAEAYSCPLATGENLFSSGDARNLLRYGGMRPTIDVLQFDPALSYGLVEYKRTLGFLGEHGWTSRGCIPHGGHQMALHAAAGLHLGGSESYPGIFAPFGGFADGFPIEDSRVRIPDAPGIGIELKRELRQLFGDLVA